MTITKYTFFSPNGNDYPVTANADAKLYMMLTGMGYNDLRIKHWVKPLDTALNRVYVNTSLVVGGRYFELHDHSVTLTPATTNYIHAVIDLSDVGNPVTLTVERSNATNTTDINNNSGILKVCFEAVKTDGSSITNASIVQQIMSVDKLKANDEEIKTNSGKLTIGNGIGCSWQRKGDTVFLKWTGTLSTITNGSPFANKAPEQIRPNEVKELVGHFASGSISFHIDLEPDGTFRWWGGNNTGAARGSSGYFIK